jgi:hypothetical protein
LSGLSFKAENGQNKPNPDTALFLSKDYYYGQTLGLKDIQGGKDV